MTWACEQSGRGVVDKEMEDLNKVSVLMKIFLQFLIVIVQCVVFRGRELEGIMSSVLINPRPQDYWRGGTKKTSFNYLLLDPNITQDLPLRQVI